MKSAILFLFVFVSVIGCNNVRGHDHFEFMREHGSSGQSSQRSAPSAPKINNVTITRIVNAAYTDDDFYDSESKSPHVVDCRGLNGQIHAAGLKAMCNPKPTLVKLNPDPGYEYSPSIVILKRCKGPCGHGTQSCMVLESTFKSIYLKRKQKANGLRIKPSECVEIEVVEHTRCKCGCDLMAIHCNKRQKYYPQSCECKCQNLKEKMICETKDDMEWDPQTCRCNCRMEEEICSTGLVWVPSLCKCAQIMDNVIASIG